MNSLAHDTMDDPPAASLTPLECSFCGAFVAHLQVSRTGRKRTGKERKALWWQNDCRTLVCSQTCRIALMQRPLTT